MSFLVPDTLISIEADLALAHLNAGAVHRFEPSTAGNGDDSLGGGVSVPVATEVGEKL